MGDEGGIPMKCPKCNGFMVRERFTDYSVAFYAWRCINCGTIIDNTILENKSSKQRKTTYRRRVRTASKVGVA